LRQVPLDLAYALTIHRSQGMGFDFVEVHVDKVFEPGQGELGGVEKLGIGPETHCGAGATRADGTGYL